MQKINKKHKQILLDTAARWKDTILRTGRADVDAAKKLIQKVYRNSAVFVVDTPAQFYIAQGIIRKRTTKVYAKEVVCPAFNIKPDFINELRGCGGPIEMVVGRQWSRRDQNTIMDRTWYRYMNALAHDAVYTYTGSEAYYERMTLRGPTRWSRPRNENTNLNNFLLYQTCDLHSLYWEFARQDPPSARVGNAINSNLAFTTQRSIENACLTLSSVISRAGADIVEDRYDFQAHMGDATNSEIMCRIMNCKSPEITFFHELFHLVPAVMRFRNAFLLLAERPKIALNENKILHSNSGPAVAYQDGINFWFFDGHILREQGPKIIMQPETLTGEEVDKINNEEERRIAIERMGWEKYLVEIGATVLDTRENWVDNTTEVLFKTTRKRAGRDEPLRALLACRSTGRRYFLAVPTMTETTYWKREDSKPIQTCEDVQKWMADGATTEFLPYANHSVRVIGAS